MADLPDTLQRHAAHSIKQLRGAVAEYRIVAYPSSLGTESAVLTDTIWTAVPEIGNFTIDTRRLYPVTGELESWVAHAGRRCRERPDCRECASYHRRYAAATQ